MEPFELDVWGLKIAGLRRRGDGERCLCLHGWMDNAASFVPLAGELPALDWAAIDLPGHGRSGHFPPGHGYQLLDQVGWVLGAADALGWQCFTLIGHSLGGCIAPFVAVAAPARVASLVMLEASGPLTEDEDELPARLARAVSALRGGDRRLRRLYTAVEDAVSARLNATQMASESAALIVERNLRETDSGYAWGFDEKIRLPSPHYLSEGQVLATLRAVTAPSLVVLAERGRLVDRAQTALRLGALRRAVRVDVPGAHHMHMDQPADTAAAIATFLRHRRDD